MNKIYCLLLSFLVVYKFLYLFTIGVATEYAVYGLVNKPLLSSVTNPDKIRDVTKRQM